MATEDQGAEHPEDAAGPKGKGKGHHPGHGLLTGPHRDEILVASSVVLVVLAWLTLRRSSGSSGGAAAPAQLTPSSMVTGGQVAGYDQNVMAGFQTMLANQADQLTQLNANLAGATAPGGTSDPGGSSTPPPPIASTLFAPTYSGQYVSFSGSGGLQELESDGSLLHLTPSQWADVIKHNGGVKPAGIQVNGNSKTDYTTGGNATAVFAKPTLRPGQVAAV